MFRFLTLCALLLCMVPSMTPSLAPGVALAQDITILSGEWPPYTGKDLKQYGVANEIATHAFLSAGYDPSYAFMPWARAEKDIMQGNALCSTAWSATKERQKWAVFSEPLAPMRNVVFYMKGRLGVWDYEGPEQLKALRVGGIGGYFYEKGFAEEGVKMDMTHTLESLVRKLYMGRVDVFVEDELVGWAVIRDLYPNELHKFASSVTPYHVTDVRLMCSKKHPDTAAALEAFAKGLRRIKDEGLYDKIMALYR